MVQPALPEKSLAKLLESSLRSLRLCVLCVEYFSRLTLTQRTQRRRDAEIAEKISNIAKKDFCVVVGQSRSNQHLFSLVLCLDRRIAKFELPAVKPAADCAKYGTILNAGGPSQAILKRALKDPS